MFGISEEFTEQCVERFGADNRQLDILQEECAELIKACSKVKRGKDSLDNLKEELSHVAISSSVIANIYGITQEDIEAEVNKKREKYNFE